MYDEIIWCKNLEHLRLSVVNNCKMKTAETNAKAMYPGRIYCETLKQ